MGGWEGAGSQHGECRKGYGWNWFRLARDCATVKLAIGFVAGCRCGGVCAFISPLASSTPPTTPYPTPPHPRPTPHILPHPNTHLAAPRGDEAAPGQGQLVVLDPHLLHERYILLVPAQGGGQTKSKHRSSTVRAEFGRGKGLRSLLCPAHACMLSPHPVLQECP